MYKKWSSILFISLAFGCSSGSDWKELDLKTFTIAIPKQWEYLKDQGMDSFVGEIKGPKVILFFDCSGMGYANHLENSPEEENSHTDTSDKFIIKTLWPKITGKGMTGIYIQSRKSTFNFQMNGKNLSKKDQELALQVFKTIKFKD
jgi:hypothetical protein